MYRTEREETSDETWMSGSDRQTTVKQDGRLSFLEFEWHQRSFASLYFTPPFLAHSSLPLNHHLVSTPVFFLSFPERFSSQYRYPQRRHASVFFNSSKTMHGTRHTVMDHAIRVSEEVVSQSSMQFLQTSSSTVSWV